MSLMIVPSPTMTGFTVYSKRKCKHCVLVKDLLMKEDDAFTMVECDSYLDEERVDAFLDAMESFVGTSCRKFPMVFRNGIFVGGYKETVLFLERNNLIADVEDHGF